MESLKNDIYIGINKDNLVKITSSNKDSYNYKGLQSILEKELSTLLEDKLVKKIGNDLIDFYYALAKSHFSKA